MSARQKTRLGVSVVLILLGVAFVTFRNVPDFGGTVALAVGSDRVLLSRDEQLLEVVRTDFKKRRLGWMPLSQFSPAVIKAVMEAEDRRFLSHSGVDFTALVRASYAIARRRHVQGASTLTMQVTDLIQPEVLRANRPIQKGSVIRKVRQVWRALWLERKWSKTEILEAYLNLIHLRGEYQGVPALSYAYFKKSPALLGEEESSAIAAMIASPNQGVRQLQRKSCVLLHKISRTILSATESGACDHVEKVVANMLGRPALIPAAPNLAPHLARRLLQTHPDQPVVHSYVDRDLQNQVQEILARHISRLKAKNVHDAAAIVIDNHSGEVLAYVGAVKDSPSPYVDGVVAPRQAGSSLKPFIYGRGFDDRLLTAASILLDEGTAISWSGGVYRPTNYDRQFSGPVSVREALGSSLNVPAVKALITIGLQPSYHLLQQLHFSDLREPDQYGVSLALGAVDVRLEELANAYRAFANGGIWKRLRYSPGLSPSKTSAAGIVAAVGGKKQASESMANFDGERVFSPEASFIVANILSDANARAIGFGWDSPLETPFWTAVKTGTSKDYRDNWCVGFSDRYTVGVWAGNFNSEAMKEVSGVSGAAPSWYEIMTYLHRAQTSKAPPVPDGVVAKSIRHEWVSNEHAEYFIKGTEPNASVVETAPDKRAQFVFPAEGSVLVKDPKIDPKFIGMFVRFKGQIPRGTELRLDQKTLGPALSPFKIDDLKVGRHELALNGPRGELLTSIQFTVKGAEQKSFE